MKTHRCEESLFLKKSIRKEEFCGLEYWIIRDYFGYEPLFDDHLDSIVNLKYCPYCGDKLDKPYQITHYDIPFEKRLYIYKCLKNGYYDNIYKYLQNTAFKTIHTLNVGNANELIDDVVKISIDYADQLDNLKYLRMDR